MSTFATRRAILTATAALGLAMGMSGLAGVAAQDATPAASGIDCAEALGARVQGIGDAGVGCVNFVHAAPDAPAVDIVIDDGATSVRDLAFGQATGYVGLPADTINVKVVPRGASLDKAVIDVDVTLEPGRAYEVLAVGPVAEIAPAIFPVDLAALESMDEAAVRVIHASPDAPGVDIAPDGGDPLVTNLEFPKDSGYLTVPAGEYDLEVRPTGTKDVALQLDPIEVEAGKVYSVVAIGTLADETLTVLPLVSGAPSEDAEAEATPSS